MRANNRLPGFVGDLRAQVGAARLGVARLEELIERYGTETVLASVDANIADTARQFRAEVASWPDGTYEADATSTTTRSATSNLHVHVAVTVDEDHLTVDFTGSATRPEIQRWSTYGNTVAM